MSVVKSIILGILAAFFSLVAELAFSVFPNIDMHLPLLNQVTWMMVSAVVIEESFKYAIIFKSFSHLERKREIIASSLLLGSGFASTEIAFNIAWKTSLWPLSPFLLGIFFIHVLTSVFAGFLVAKKENAYFTAIRALIFNICLHLIYNIAILYLF